jgi:O-antigen ligase
VNNLESSEHVGGRLERCTWYAFLACVALVPLAVSKLPSASLPLTWDVFAFPHNVVLAVGTAVALTLWAATRIARQTELVLSPLLVPFAVFLVWAGLATAAAYEPLRSLFGRSTSSLALINLLAYAALFFLAVQLLDSRRRMRVLTWTTVGSAGVVALIAILQQLFQANVFGLPSIDEWLTGRGFSTIGNPDQLGTFLVLPLVLSVFLFLFEEDALSRAAAGFCVALFATVVTGTLTRGAWVGAVAGAMAAAVLLTLSQLTPDQRRRAWLALGVGIAGILVALAASNSTDLATRFATSSPASPSPAAATADSAIARANAVSSDRINVWRSALRIVADRPLTGTGPAAFELGWYPNAIVSASNRGDVAIADDPHSLPVYVVATLGIPGLLAYVVACSWVLVFAARTSIALARSGPLTGKATYYAAWFAAACGLQVALLVGAVTTPIALYAFVSLAVLLRPSARSATERDSDSLLRPVSAATAAALGLALLVAVYPSLSAEIALARTRRGVPIETAESAVHRVPWDMTVQWAYFGLKTSKVNSLLTASAPGAEAAVKNLAAELARVGANQPFEFYYPSMRVQLLAEASSRLGKRDYAEAAVGAADEALAIMPASVVTRVNKARALGDLGHYKEMADALAGYWEYESTSAYPGILYAQALALSGDEQRADDVFSLLLATFPTDGAAIEAAKQQVKATQPGD